MRQGGGSCAYPWRIWLAFEIRPGVTRDAPDRSLWRGLRESCRDASGKFNVNEFQHWMELLVENVDMWGDA